ncbi:oxysterol-binding protein 2 isoform X2 [Seriola lalandi dorsalis]|uniref:oxysterol-binding protein 2-like n=1 Tax=Seriola dumerili TaxID=41447 RepID=UPI000BBE98B2|nr:oxysterol-binding protein 2-like [Seriola dumerili]XP_023269328.1 oxysterol-binding protein 2 isoform X2 [Seriola lalandi dorsalis]XP_056233059.1 oxysterol-binding protein 2 isoform X2 [Seriola aureovittata]
MSEQGKGSASASAAAPAPGSDTYKGWLFKWTNYLKGYQRRWFVLSNGLLSYYRTQAEMAHTCRGTINLATAHIDTEDACNIVLSSGGRTYHLKASTEVERQRWVTALELAKAKAIRMMNDQSDDSGDEEPTSQSDRSEIQGTLKILVSKLDDLSTCNDLIAKHGAALQRSLSELEGLKVPVEGGEKIKAVNERATLFRITSNAMINACRDFLDLAETHSRRWQRALQYEREQRTHLEETIEQLAKQHNSLERAWREAPTLVSSAPSAPTTNKGSERPHKEEASDEDEDTEYFDAMEDSPAFITVTATENTQHRRSQSNLSGASGGHPNDWNQDDHMSPSCNDVSGKELQPRRQRRTHIPDKPNYSLNLWSIMKNCIGKELSKIPMPVNFNEPLSMLQRLTEDLEYHELLDKAARCESSLEQMCLVAAFSVSSYSTTVHRTAKPFNPLLGETYELDRLEEFGYRSLCEQVSHHPPAAAHHVISQRGWTLWQEITIASKFRGKYLSIMPLGAIHLQFHASGNHYVWRKVTSTVHNIIVGKLWIDQSGDIEIVNHRTKETCQLKFSPYSYFSRDVPRKVTGVVSDSGGQAHYILSGTWDDKMESAKIIQSSRGGSGSEGKQKTVYQTLSPKLLWKKYPLPENADNMYYFSALALTLNELEEGVGLTDSRLRPDQRLMEDGRWDEANSEKQRLEEKQRAVRRRREAEASDALDEGKEYEGYQPLWFHQRRDSVTGETNFVYKGGYWEAKDRQDWSMCPDIF